MRGAQIGNCEMGQIQAAAEQSSKGAVCRVVDSVWRMSPTPCEISGEERRCRGSVVAHPRLHILRQLMGDSVTSTNTTHQPGRISRRARPVAASGVSDWQPDWQSVVEVTPVVARNAAQCG
ncbi:MAG: hypothetical protein INR71_00650 [Terriglobus roseus]|nr:hypothetical protein [Terriglobus roseus]